VVHEGTEAKATRVGVLASLVVNVAETLALAVAAWLSGSVALRAQTAASAADVAVGVFLFIGVFSSVRPADDCHPLGYGRERFFWSLFAALGIFVGGGGLALDGAIRAAVHPSPLDDYLLAYVVLAITLSLDAVALEIALRPVRKRAAAKSVSLRVHLQRTTDPASATIVVGGGCAVVGGLLAIAGLAISQATGSPLPDTIASALIGVVLLVASALLLQKTRGLLSGRGVAPGLLSQMRGVVVAEGGVVDVPDLFAIVVGPSSLIVDGDVTFADDMDVPAVEQAIIRATAALREHWPTIEYIYLTPVPHARPRRTPRGR
jgi:cation diffusion facilitator family transporter